MSRSCKSHIHDHVAETLQRLRPVTLRRTARITGLAALSLSAGAALAQTAPSTATAPPSDQLQEVTVTAQFRAENLQQTPLAISAVNAAALAERGQTSLTQITNDVPSVYLTPTTAAFGPSMNAYIRGIGQYDNDPALEPGVGIYVDDVYFGTLVGSLLDLMDLDRVEVLRGPQGTLEGMNSEGGAIKLFSKAPESTPSTNFDVLYGSRNHVELRASTNFALADNLFIRLAGVGNHQDGYEHILDFGCAAGTFNATDINGVTGTYQVLPTYPIKTNSCRVGEEGGVGYEGGRVSIRWLVNDRLDVLLIGDLTNENQENPAGTLIHAVALPASTYNSITLPAINTATGAAAQLPFDESKVPAMIPANPYDTYSNYCVPALTPAQQTAPPFGAAPFPPLPATPAYCAENRTTLQSWGAQANISWSIGEGLSLKNITSFRGYSSRWSEDNDASPWPLGLGVDGIGHHQFTEELRLNASLGKLLDLTVGAFYFSEKSVYATHQDLWYAIGPGQLDFLQDDPITAHDKAGYVHTLWHLTSKLDFTAGLRFTSQDKDYHYTRLNPEGTTGGTATAVSSLNGVTGHYDKDRFDYRGDLSYRFTDQAMGYVQVSTGFKGGGVDPRPFNAAQAISFGPESLTNYELGFKTTWLDNRLRLNIDGYFGDYKDIQITLNDCTSVVGAGNGIPCALPYNAGSGHQAGLELESNLRLGGFQADLSFSYLHFNYTSLSGSTGVTTSMVTPLTPKLSGNLGLQYTLPLGGSGSLTARADATSRSEVYAAAVNDPVYGRLAGQTVYNARLAWDSPNSDWQVSVQGLNVTNKYYLLNIFNLSAAGGGSVTGNPAPPREIDLEIKHKM